MNICTPLYLNAADNTSSALGRLDYASFSQQTLMEMLIEGITNRENICGTTDFPGDLSDWKIRSGESALTLNDNDDVTWISAGLLELNGHVALEWLPSTVEHFDVSTNCLTGTVTLENLPPVLVYLNMIGNTLSGTLCLESLPDSLTGLELGFNQFTGIVNLKKLPNKLTLLNLGTNRLSGSLDLTQLPETLETLWLVENDFEGLTDFTQLPETMIALSVGKNARLLGKIQKQDGLYIVNKGSKVRQVK